MRILWFLLAVVFLSPLQAIDTTTKQIQPQLTDNEKTWITEHPVIRFTGDPDWLPFEGFTEDGRYVGIISEILKIIEHQTSLKFDIVPTKTWTESITLLEKGKVDMMTVSDAWSDPEYLYTKSIIPSDIVIIMKNDHPYIDSLYYLQYESIAVIKGYHYIDEIKKKYPDYMFYEVENIQEGLEGVAEGKYDALLASMALATYTIEKMQLSNVDVVGKTEFDIKVRFAVRKEFAPLVDIINKVDVGEKQAHELLKKWTYQKYVEKTDYTLITELFLLLLVVLLAAGILYLLLKRKTQKHRNTEDILSNTHKEINNAAKYASLLDDPSKLKSDTLNTFFDDSFTIINPKTVKSSTFVSFNILNEEKAVLILIDASGNSIDAILNAMFIKTLVGDIVTRLRDNALDSDPSTILYAIEKEVRETLERVSEEKRPDNQGFDAAVVTIEGAENTLLYAGANIPLLYTKNNEVFSVRADKHSVGIGKQSYTTHTIEIVDTMNFYLLTRGYTEQDGGRQNLPFGKRRIKEILSSHGKHNMDVQKNALVKTFREYMGKHARVGDIALIGFRISEK